MRVIQADMYRLFRSKVFWITEILLMAFIFLTILFEQIGNVGVDVTISDEATAIQEAIQQIEWTSDVTMMMMSQVASTLIIMSLPMLVMIVGHDLTRKTYKNILTTGVSRLNYFLSKFLVFMLLLLIQCVIFYGVAFITSGVKNGFGEIDGEFWKTFLKMIGYQYVNMLAIFAVATFTLYLFMSNVWAVIVAFVFPTLISITYLILKWDAFKYVNFQTNIDQASMLVTQNNFMLQSLSATVLIICSVLLFAYLMFKRKSL